MLNRLLAAVLFSSLSFAAVPSIEDLNSARDRQDLTALDAAIAQLKQSAQAQPKTADLEYRTALASSYAAEVAMQSHDKRKSEGYAESGMDFARKAVESSANNAEYHRLLGQLCGQVIPANPIMGSLKYGPCARDEINKAIALDSKLALAYVSRGVGNYYLPASMGGGIPLALQDFDKAIALDPNLVEAYLWKGIALRKANRNADAHQNLQKAVQLDPKRIWAKQELDKTPAH